MGASAFFHQSSAAPVGIPKSPRTGRLNLAISDGNLEIDTVHTRTFQDESASQDFHQFLTTPPTEPAVQPGTGSDKISSKTVGQSLKLKNVHVFVDKDASPRGASIETPSSSSTAASVLGQDGLKSSPGDHRKRNQDQLPPPGNLSSQDSDDKKIDPAAHPPQVAQAPAIGSAAPTDKNVPKTSHKDSQTITLGTWIEVKQLEPMSPTPLADVSVSNPPTAPTGAGLEGLKAISLTNPDEHANLPTNPAGNGHDELKGSTPAPAADGHGEIKGPTPAPAGDSHGPTPAGDSHGPTPAGGTRGSAPASDSHGPAPASDSHGPAPAGDSHGPTPASDSGGPAPSSDSRGPTPAGDGHGPTPAGDGHSEPKATTPAHAGHHTDPPPAPGSDVHGEMNAPPPEPARDVANPDQTAKAASREFSLPHGAGIQLTGSASSTPGQSATSEPSSPTVSNQADKQSAHATTSQPNSTGPSQASAGPDSKPHSATEQGGEGNAASPAPEHSKPDAKDLSQFSSEVNKAFGNSAIAIQIFSNPLKIELSFTDKAQTKA